MAKHSIVTLVKTNHARVFEKVYRLRAWGQGSGPGSRENSTEAYRMALQYVLKGWKIRRVIDLGCGDWEFSRLLDWSEIEYLGLDVVSTIIENNTIKYSNATIRFECADIRYTTLKADLFIFKDVLQHWPTQDVQQFLNRMRGKRMLITNTHTKAHATTNSDIELGEFRPLSLLAFPFKLGPSARMLLEYAVPGNDEQKQVIFIDEDKDLGK